MNYKLYNIIGAMRVDTKLRPFGWTLWCLFDDRKYLIIILSGLKVVRFKIFMLGKGCVILRLDSFGSET